MRRPGCRRKNPGDEISAGFDGVGVVGERARKIPSQVMETLSEDADRWGLSAVSVWEVARRASLAERKPKHPSVLDLKAPFREWMAKALDPEDYAVLPLTPEISPEAKALPGEFHDVRWIKLL